VIDEVGSNAKNALAHAYFVLDFVYLDQGRVQDAVYSPTSLAIYEELEDLAMQGFVLNNMGTDAYFRGRWDEAIQLYERGRAIQLRLGDADGAALGTNNIGEIRSDQGRLSEAEQLFGEVLRLSRAEGHQSLMAFALSNLGRVASRLGRYEDSSELLEQARALFHQIDERAQVLETKARIAELDVLRGDWEQALSSSAETLKAVEAAAGDGTQTPMLHRIRGYALMQAGRLGEAGDALDESLRVGRLREARFEIALTLEALARLAELRGTSPDPELRAESRSILGRLGVESLPEVPLAALSTVSPVE